MTISLRSTQGGSGDLEICISVTDIEANALGKDAQYLAEFFDGLLWALGMLRAGVNSRDPGNPVPVPGDWVSALHCLQKLSPRLQGALESAVLEFIEAGGSVDHLANAMGVDRSDALRYVTDVQNRSRAMWAQWAAAKGRSGSVTGSPSPPQTDG